MSLYSAPIYGKAFSYKYKFVPWNSLQCDNKKNSDGPWQIFTGKDEKPSYNVQRQVWYFYKLKNAWIISAVPLIS